MNGVSEVGEETLPSAATVLTLKRAWHKIRAPMGPGQRVAVAVIDRYRVRKRATGRCVFTPTCSEYARIAFTRHGAFRGSVMTVKRLLRCHGGYAGAVDYPN